MQWKKKERERERERERWKYGRERPLSLYWRKWENIFVVRKLEDKRGYASSYVREGNCVHMISLVMLHVVPSSIMRKPIFSLFLISALWLLFSVIERHKTEKQLSEEGSPFPSPGRSLSKCRKNELRKSSFPSYWIQNKIKLAQNICNSDWN